MTCAIHKLSYSPMDLHIIPGHWVWLLHPPHVTNSPIGLCGIQYCPSSLKVHPCPTPSICRNKIVSTCIFLSVGMQWSGTIVQIICVTSLLGWICVALLPLDHSVLSVVKGFLWLKSYKHFNNCYWLCFFDP